MLLLSHPVLEIVSALSEWKLRYAAKLTLNTYQLMHQRVVLFHLLRKYLHLFRHIMRAASIWRDGALPAVDGSISVPSTSLAFTFAANVVLRVAFYSLVASTSLLIRHRWYLAKRSLHRHLWFALIRVRYLVVAFIQVFVRFLERKCMNAFQRLSFDPNLVLIWKVGVRTAARCAQSTCVIGQIRIIFEHQRWLFFGLI